MKSTKSSWKFLRRALRCNTGANWHFVIRLHTKLIKCYSRNRMDDAMFKVAESILLKLETTELSDLQKKQSALWSKIMMYGYLHGAKVSDHRLSIDMPALCPIGLHSTICKGNADYSTLNREHFVMPKGRSDSPMGTGDELGHQNASKTHAHMQGALRDQISCGDTAAGEIRHPTGGRFQRKTSLLSQVPLSSWCS